MTAEELIAAGFVQISSQYRTLARVPTGKTALEALAELAPEEYGRLQEKIERWARDTLLRVYAHKVETVVVSIETFAEFKRLGGDVA